MITMNYFYDTTDKAHMNEFYEIFTIINAIIHCLVKIKLTDFKNYIYTTHYLKRQLRFKILLVSSITIMIKEKIRNLIEIDNNELYRYLYKFS